MENIKQGSIISGANWPEPVEVKLIEEVEEFEGYIRIVGTTTSSRDSIDDVISQEELSKCSVMGTGSAFTEDPGEVFLALEAMRYRFAFLYDPLLAMNASKVDPLPHQIEAVYGHVLKLPRIRFLIADDPGAGKTIMAGLIIKELKLRNLAKRILIVAPGHLKDQWRRELDDRFEEKFIVIDRGLLDAHYAENVWGRESQIITSIDFAKREDIIPSISSVHFDLIIVDEAHKMSAYRYGDKIDKTSRYRLGEVLSRNTNHFLFLTATPHKGDPDNFRLFLDLLEPGFFATNEMLQESIRNDENRLFIRRVKEDLRDFEGNPLFLPRHVTTVSFNLGTESPSEKDLYNALSKYVNTQYNKALTKDKRRNVAFALVILQRRLASSTYALRESLRRRKNRLQELLEGAQERARNSDYVPDRETVEDSSEEERWEQEAIWETLSVSENRQELEEEIRTIESLISRADSIIQNEEEIKLKELRSCLVELAQKYPEQRDKKILIFTESKDTLDYLEEKIKLWGYSVNTIHGGMRLEERVGAEGVFKNETQLMVATEAAGEGINLQFCHLMLNYDIPWNPNRIEQRMGRIHRYGQQKEVYVFNLVAEDTREGRVLNALLDKLEEIKNALGSDKVFDFLSEVLYGKSLSQILIEAAANARDIDDILKEIGDVKVDDEYIAEVKENLGESLATRYIDYTRIKEMAQEAREQRLIPEYTESFFRKAFVKAGGSLRDRTDGFLAIESIPYNIRRLADDNAFKRRYGELVRRYPKATFDKEMAFKNPDAEFISFGHPLFESIMAWIESSFSDSPLNGGTFADPDGRMDGYILFYEGEIKDGTGAVAGKRLFGFYLNVVVQASRLPGTTETVILPEVEPIFPAVVWDLEEKVVQASRLHRTTETVILPDIDLLKRKASGSVILELEQYKKEILKERDRQTEIKRKYGVKSLDQLIVQLDGEIIVLYGRKENGENVDLVIRNKEERKEEYEKALQELKEQIQKERSLTMGMPRFVGIIRVEPSDRIADDMETDPEAERIAMKVSMDYEIRNGREPEDVSDQKLGFDIRSKDKGGDKRRIEVKGRTRTGAVELTQNEWFKAKSLKDDYYLYAVMNTATNPKLYIIQNPAENLAAKEKIDVRYLVPFGEIKAKGETKGDSR